MARRTKDKRQHPRFELACPTTVFKSSGDVVGTYRTVNISDGGVIVPIPAEDVPRLGAKLQLYLAVPHHTKETYHLEHFALEGKVLRKDEAGENVPLQVAIQFTQPRELTLAGAK